MINKIKGVFYFLFWVEYWDANNAKLDKEERLPKKKLILQDIDSDSYDITIINRAKSL